MQKFRNIFLCASIEENQKPILDKEMIDLIQTNSTLINVSRGELIDEDYLIKSSVKKNIKLCLDVLQNDSDWDEFSEIGRISELNNKSNIILTPHCGGYAYDAILATRNYVLKKYLNEK